MEPGHQGYVQGRTTSSDSEDDQQVDNDDCNQFDEFVNEVPTAEIQVSAKSQHSTASALDDSDDDDDDDDDEEEEEEEGKDGNRFNDEPHNNPWEDNEREDRRRQRYGRGKEVVNKEQDWGGKTRFSRRSVNICIGIVCFLGITAVVLAVLFALDDDETHDIGMCGNCHCIVGPGDDETCPAMPPNPRQDFPVDFVEALLDQEPLNPVPELQCDPFRRGCKPAITGPTSAVCGLHYTDTFSCAKYKMQTYEYMEQAQDSGAFVTHTGPCGVCSTTQDLAMLIQFTDYETITEKCQVHALTDVVTSQSCFERLGFSKPCAKLYSQQARVAEEHCLLTCQTSDLRNTPFNGPPPKCELNACLKCKQDLTGKIFDQFGGRTVRSSGLLSSITRPCSEIANITQYACPTTRSIGDSN